MMGVASSGAAWRVGGERHAPPRARVWGRLALIAVMLSAACFRDDGPGQLCVGSACVVSTSSSSSSGGEPTSTSTGAPDSTGAPVDPAITLRIDSMAFVDPHLFLSDAGEGTGTTGEPMSECVMDVTNGINNVLNEDIDAGEFNLLLHLEDFTRKQEMRLIGGDCEPPTMAGGLRTCVPKNSTPAIILITEVVGEPGCRALDEAVYAPVDVPLINDPQPPCLRTQRASFSLSISDSVGALDLREAQLVANLDSAAAPTRLTDGELYGFLPQAAAELIELEVPIYGLVDLWSVIEASACTATYPELLPSVDTLLINDKPAPGAWVAINFTAEQVEYTP